MSPRTTRWTFDCSVVQRENLETLYLISNKGQSIIAKTTATAEFRLGDTVNVVPNMEKAKFFEINPDAAEELNICDVIEKKW